MRTIDEIKRGMEEAWMSDAVLAEAYGFTVGDSWGGFFSKVSVENLLLYIVAVAIHVVEVLMGEHKAEVEALIDAEAVHRPKWYRDKVLRFMKGKTLAEGTDVYDTTGMTESDIEEAQVVKYAAATESADSSVLTIKVAGRDSEGSLQKLDEETEGQLNAYIREVKDAGVRVKLVNMDADEYSCDVTVFYDAMLTGDTVREKVEETIGAYITGLPFNGEYTNMALTDRLQTVEGVKIVEVRSAKVQVSGESTETVIDMRYRPRAGYLKVNSEGLNITMKAYDEQV